MQSPCVMQGRSRKADDSTFMLSVLSSTCKGGFMKSAIHGAVGAFVAFALIFAFGMRICRAEGLPTVVGLHTVSIHTERGEGLGWNNRNPGIYARWDNGLTVGTYRNSMFKQSYYLGYTLVDSEDRFAITLGVVSGYDRLVGSSTPGAIKRNRCDGGCRDVYVKETLLPLVVPSMRVPLTAHTSLRVAAVFTPKAPPAAHLMIERSFK